MKSKPSKQAFRTVLIVAIISIALTALIGCGIGHRPYRHGYDGRHADYYRSGYGHSGAASTDTNFNHRHNGIGPMTGHGQGRSGYCAW